MPETGSPLALMEDTTAEVRDGCIVMGEHALFFVADTQLYDHGTVVELPDGPRYRLDGETLADFGGGEYELFRRNGEPRDLGEPLMDQENAQRLQRCAETLGVRYGWYVTTISMSSSAHS